jgi:hypothetical protein
MTTRDNSIIYIGQQSQELEKSINSLYRRFQLQTPSSVTIQEYPFLLPPPPQSSSKVKPTKPRKDTRSNCYELYKCSHHHLFSFDFCRFCQANSELIVDSYRNLLEQQDLAPSLSLVFEGYTQFGLWSYLQLVELISIETKNSAYGSVLLKSVNGVNGLENFYFLHSAVTALTSSTFCTVRGVDEYLSEVTDPHLLQQTQHEQPTASSQVKTNSSGIAHIQDGYDMIACDLFLGLDNHNSWSYGLGQYSLWPYHICSANNKLIDIRTSLYRSLQKLDKNKRKGIQTTDIVPMRLAVSNLHHLHLYYENKGQGYMNALKNLSYFGSYGNVSFQVSSTIAKAPAKKTSINGAVAIADFISQIDLGGALGESQFGSSRSNVADVKASLAWATNGSTWELLEENKFNFPSDATESNKPVKSKIPKGSDSIENSTTRSELEVAAIAFKSVYAETDLKCVSSNSQQLMKRKAYDHILSKTSLSYETLYNDLLYLEEYSYLAEYGYNFRI